MRIIRIKLICLLLLLLASCTQKENVITESILISDIQGCGHISPRNNQLVTGVEGVVTHKFKTGFTIQALNSDDRDCSSEAVFVFTVTYPDVIPGQVVTIDGKVEEFYAGSEENHNLSRTEIHDPVIKILPGQMSYPNYISLHDGKQTTPDRFIDSHPEFDILRDGLDYYESLEFMLVGVDNGSVVGPKNSFNEFIVLPSTKSKTNLISEHGNLLLSDGDENPEIIMINVASSFTQRVNIGDQFTTPIVGIMDYSFGNYKIWTITDPEIKPVKHEKVFIQRENDNSLTIASYNIENFSLFDDEKIIRGISCQIANDLDSPDILVLHEVLDDSGTVNDNVVTAKETLERLIEEIRQCGGPAYLASDNPPEDDQDGGIDGGNIRSVVLYRTEKGLILEQPDMTVDGLAVRNGHVIIEENPYRFAQKESAFWGTRKPTAWLFSWRNEKIIILGTHLVSQAATTPLWGNLQPPAKPEQSKRENQARFIGDIIERISNLDDDLRIIVAGDLNDYPWSVTLTEITNEILVEPSPLEPDFARYSYVFEGKSFQFDYILVDEEMDKRILNYKILHINTSYSQDSRFSDHDPVYIELSGN